MGNVHEVTNPIYLTIDEIREKYWDRQVLITNVEMTPSFSKIAGGIVRYYAVDAMEEMYQTLNALRKTEGEAIESYTIKYIGNIYLNLYAGGGVS